AARAAIAHERKGLRRSDGHRGRHHRGARRHGGSEVLMKPALVGCAAFLFSATAAAGPAETFGFGSRSTAMGGAVSAGASDVSANYYSPAGLASAKGLTLEVGYVRASYWLKMNGRDNDVDPVRAITFSLVAPGEVKGIPFAFGVGLHLPDARVFRVRSLDQ